MLWFYSSFESQLENLESLHLDLPCAPASQQCVYIFSFIVVVWVVNPKIGENRRMLSSKPDLGVAENEEIVVISDSPFAWFDQRVLPSVC